MSQFVQRQNTTPQQDWSSLIAHSSAVADRYSKRNERTARVANQLQANMIAKGQKGSAVVNASTGRVTMDKDFMDNFVAKKDQDLTKAPSITSDAKILDDPQQQKALNEYISTAKNAEERTKKVNEFYQGIADGTRSFPGQNLGRNQLLNNQIQDPTKKGTTDPAADAALAKQETAIKETYDPATAKDAIEGTVIPKLAGTPDPNATSPEAVAKLAQATGLNIKNSEKDTSKESVSTGASLDMDSKNKRDMTYKPTVVSESTVQKGVYDDTKMSLEQLSGLQNFAQIMGSTDGTSMATVPTQWDHMIVQRQNELKAAQAALEPDFKQDIKQGEFTDKSDFSFTGGVDTKDSRNITNITTGGVSVGNTTGGKDPNSKRLNFQGIDGTYSLNTVVKNGQSYAEPVTNAKFGTKMMNGKHYLSGDQFKAVTKQMQLSTTGKKYGYTFEDDGAGNMQIFKQGKLVGAYNGWRQLDTYEQIPLSEFQFLAGGAQQTGSDANDE